MTLSILLGVSPAEPGRVLKDRENVRYPLVTIISNPVLGAVTAVTGMLVSFVML
jgi:acetyl-CoA carboxylase beta subunit